MTRVMVFGTFDLLHEGHKKYFEWAKQHGDELFVVVSSDVSAKKRGKVLEHSQEARAEVLEALSIVDKVVLGREKNHMQTVLDHKPSILVLGPDDETPQVILKATLKAHGLDVQVLRSPAFEKHKYSSSALRRK